MAYYTALINEWATLTGTTQQKLTAINALTVTGTVPSSLTVSGVQMLNCINWAEFNALTAQEQSNLLLLCAVDGVNGQILGGSANAGLIAGGMFLAYFSHTGPTIAALTALAQGIVQPWWQANGYSSPISPSDLVAAGGLT